MKNIKLTIGIIPTRRDVFSKKDALHQKNLLLDKLREYKDIEFIDINDINEEGLLFDENDILKIVDKMSKKEVKGIFFPHCNFGSELLVAKVAKLINKPVLLWGPRDDAPKEDGIRTRDTQCGLFATGKMLRRFKIPFTYLINSDYKDNSFKNGLEMWFGVCSAVHAFRSLKILQVSTRPESFGTMIINEGELLERFGIQVVPVDLIEISEVMNHYIKNDADKVKKEIEYISNIYDLSEITEKSRKNMAALKLALKNVMEEKGCRAAAIQCWHSMQKIIGIMPCAINGILADEKICVACETDICGAISSELTQAAAMYEETVFLADMTIRHPSNNNGELLWHCGNFPPSLAKENGKIKAGKHFIFPSHCDGTGEFELKHGDLTICRFDGDNNDYKLFIGEGKGIQGPATKGTYLWMEVGNWPMWERKLVEGPYVHHCAVIHKKIAPILYEVCKYIPGLSADCAQPSEEEIKGLWDGN